MMHMTFYWGRKVTLLFDFWKTSTWMEYGLTLAACLLFSVFYQYVEDRRLRFKKLSISSSSVAAAPGAPPSSVDDTPLLVSSNRDQKSKLFGAGFGGRWTSLAGAVMFGINSAIGYMLMLAIMSFNGGVFVAVVVGLALGYLFFRSSDDDVLVLDNPCACA
ncbi:copper transporter 5.1 [Diospyros lotus]|uniref:copper transporter 5.1 n=1 Tax=Diospyros lotus TaxID=55363 RepID=UPI002250EA36|nr:copper transporter 5.1 [Diospyros lotus]